MAAPHDVPTAEQLVESVREWIERDVMPVTSGRLQFHARVAANVLAMVERELAAGNEMVEAHVHRLAALGVTDDEQLATAIRNGALDDRLDDVRAAVRASVEDKLRVANPRYLGVSPDQPASGQSGG